jgi:hypothetical protein
VVRAGGVAMSKTALWISAATLVVSILTLGPAYLVFFDKSDLVYETQIENIHLPKDLPGKLPDALVIVTVENVGRRPSVDLQGSITVSGDLVEYQVQGPNPAYGQVSHSRNNLQILFSCSRFAPGEYPIKISAWYRSANSDPDVGVSDSRGAARRVNSIGEEKGKYRQVATGILGLLVGLIGSFVAIWTTYRAYLVRRSISDAARQLKVSAEKLRPVTDQIGTAADEVVKDE